MNDFCPVESDLNAHQRSLDRGESKDARIREWLKTTGRVEDAIEKHMRESCGEFEQFVAEHEGGYALVQLGLWTVRAYLFGEDFDPDGLKEVAEKVFKDFIADQHDAFEEMLVEREWDYFDVDQGED